MSVPFKEENLIWQSQEILDCRSGDSQVAHSDETKEVRNIGLISIFHLFLNIFHIL